MTYPQITLRPSKDNPSLFVVEVVEEPRRGAILDRVLLAVSGALFLAFALSGILIWTFFGGDWLALFCGSCSLTALVMFERQLEAVFPGADGTLD